MTSKKHQNQHEIDLPKVINCIWNNKLKILLITAATMVIMYVSQVTKEPIRLLYSAETEIRPISTFDESKYSFYNSYLARINENGSFLNHKNLLINENSYNSGLSNLLVINKKTLTDLFIDKLNQNSTYIDAIKKFKLVTKKNYSDNSRYEDAVIKLASSIRLIAPNDNENKMFWSVNLQVSDLKNIKKFFKFVEKKANQEVQLYLNNTLKSQIVNQKKLIKFEIEDIDIQLSDNLENYEKAIELIVDPIKKESLIKELNNLKMRKNFLISSKVVERFEDIFQDTPISNSNQFYAAKLMVDSIKTQNLAKEEYSLLKKLLLAGILGLILGMLYVFLSNIINTKK